MTTHRTVRLRSGDTVAVRPIRRTDAPALAEGVARLSEQSRHRRFHSPMPRLSERMLDYLTDIDHHDHEALVALPIGSTEIVGVARFIRWAGTPDSAEMAVVVADDWQRRGLGAMLLRALAQRANEVGVDHFTAEILAENSAVLELVGRLGPTETSQDGPTVTARMDNTSWQRSGSCPAPTSGPAAPEPAAAEPAAPEPPAPESAAPEPDGADDGDRRAGSWLRSLAAADAVLVPPVARTMLKVSAGVTRTLVVPVTNLLDQRRSARDEEPGGG